MPGTFGRHNGIGLSNLLRRRSDDELIDRGYVALYRKRFWTAMRFARALHRRGRPEAYEVEARIARERRNYPRSIELLQTGTERHPHAVALWRCLGDFHRNSYSTWESVNAYECMRLAGEEDLVCDMLIARLPLFRDCPEEALEKLELLDVPATSDHYWAFLDLTAECYNYMRRYEETLAILPPPVPPSPGVSRSLRATLLCREIEALLETRKDFDVIRAKACEAYGFHRTKNLVQWALYQCIRDRTETGFRVWLKVEMARWVGEPDNLRKFWVAVGARDADHAIEVLRQYEPEETRDRIRLLRKPYVNRDVTNDVGIMEIEEIG